MQRDDRPRKTAIIWCRKVFGDLEVWTIDLMWHIYSVECGDQLCTFKKFAMYEFKELIVVWGILNLKSNQIKSKITKTQHWYWINMVEHCYPEYCFLEHHI